MSSRLATAHRMLARRLRARGFAPAGVLALSITPGFGVSEVQAQAVVHAAVASPRAAVSRLAREVTKILLLEKLRSSGLAALAVALVAAAVVGLSSRSQVAAETPKVETPPEQQEVQSPRKAPAEPDWKKEFRDRYGLKDGEHIRRIAPPYPKCRSEYLAERFGGRAGRIPFDDHFTVLRWKGNWAPAELAKHTLPVKPDDGIALGRLVDMACGVPRTRIEDPEGILNGKVTGDFVVRDESSPENVAKQLGAILKKECKVDATFEFKEEEREVFVLSGKYQAKPLEGRARTEIEIFGHSLVDRSTGGGGSGTFDKLLAHVERHIHHRVVAEKIEGTPKRVSWHDNVRSPMIKDPANGIDTYAEDTNAAAVLNNLADQTGLKLAVAKRKVKLLVVKSAKVEE
jgi:hypothetical protein